MCKQEHQLAPTPEASPHDSLTDADKEIRRANLQVQLATLRSNAEYNASPAGQMQRQFETYQRIAKPLSESKFVPAAYQGNLGDCIIAVEMAARLGTYPLAVMQNLCIVKGNPTWKSKFLIGCVNTCGRYTTLDYRFANLGPVGEINYKTWQKGKDGKNHEILKPFPDPRLDNIECVAFATEIATGKTLTSPPVSIRMAIQEGWYSKDGSKWPTMPQLMLRYRAASFWVSTFAPEISMGLHTEEEQRDIIDIEYDDLTPASAPTPAPRRRPTSSAAIEEAKQKLRTRPLSAPSSTPKDETENPTTQMP